MAHISVTDQAISPRNKFLPLPLSTIIENDLKEKEGANGKKNGANTTLTGNEEEKEEEKSSKAGEEKADEEQGQGQPPEVGNVQVPSLHMVGRDGPYKKSSITGEDEDENSVFLGLKVYTKEAVVAISGRVRDGPENEDEDEWEDEEGDGDDGDEDEDE